MSYQVKTRVFEGPLDLLLQLITSHQLEITDLRLVDSETASTLDITGTGELVAIYREYLQKLLGQLDALCKRRGGQFLSLDADLSIEFIVRDVMRRRGWIR